MFYNSALTFIIKRKQLNLTDCEGTIIADQRGLSAVHCAVLITEKFKKGRKHFVIINDVENGGR